MRIGTNLGRNYKLSSTCDLYKEVLLYRSGLCNKVVIKYALDLNYCTMRSGGLCIDLVVKRWSLINGFTLVYMCIKI